MGRKNPARSNRRWFAAILVIAWLTPVFAVPQELLFLVVEEVAADSPASKAGIQPGDRLLSYDGKLLASPQALQAAEDNTVNKDEVMLSLRRGEETRMLQAPRGRLGLVVRPELPPSSATPYEEGRAALTAGKSGDAIISWTTAAKRAQESGNTAAAAWLYGRVGDIHETQRQWKEARETHTAAVELLKPSLDRAALSRALSAVGRCDQNLNQFSSALQWFEQAEQADIAAGNELWVAGALTNIGNVIRLLGDLPRAENYHNRALSIRDRLAPNSLDVAASLHNLGVVAQVRGDLTLSDDFYRRALVIKQRLAPDSLTLATTLANISEVLRLRGDLDAATDHSRRALIIRERLAADSLDLASSLTTLGIIAHMRSDLSAAADYFNRCLAIRDRLAPDSLLVAGTLSNLGVVYWSRGELAAAHEAFNRSLTIQERLAPDSLAVAASFTNLGLVAKDQSDLAGAQHYLSRGLAIRERLSPNSLNVAASLNNLGTLAKDRGDLAEAQDYLVRSLAIKERLAPDSLDVASTLTNLGLLAHSREALAEAQNYLVRALAIQERLAPGSLDGANTLNDLGKVARSRGDLPAALDFYRRSHAIFERLTPDALDTAGSLNILGNIALDQGRAAEALPLFTRAVDIVEAQRRQVRSAEGRTLMLAAHTDSYTGLLRSQLGLNDAAGAFVTAERARARSLLELLAETGADIRQGVDPELLAQKSKLQQQLNAKADQQLQVIRGRHTGGQAAAAKKEIDSLMVQYREVQEQIRIKSPRYAALTQPQPLGLREIQQELDDDSLLLEYVLGKEASYLWAVTPASIRSFELPRRADIEQAARGVYELLRARQPVSGETLNQRQSRIARADAAYPAAAARLSTMVLGPASGLLVGKRLLIVADGALQYVPFGALPPPSAPGGVDTPPLIVNHEIVSLPSASVLAVLRRESKGRPPARRSVAVLADPVFDADDPRLKLVRQNPPAPRPSLPADVSEGVRSAGLFDARGSLSRLPFSRDEAEAIMALAPSGQSSKAIDFKANRETAMSAELSQYRIVHLATHGLLDTEHPELSGIVLSLVDEQGNPQDGFLRLHEVYNLQWPAELVVLSACQTALGKEMRGEGLIGLTRGFMYAGAQRVLASLWSINDSVTAEFMRRFYQGLLAKRLSPAAALRAAQVEMWKRRTSSAPFYWAAFVLQGEWR